MKITKKKLQKIIKEELEMSQNGSDMAYSGPKAGLEMDDLEGKTTKEQLCHIAKYAIAMARVLEEDQELESWVQSKITIAHEYLSKVKHHLEYELQVDMPEPSIEEMSELLKKDEKVELEKDSYAGQGKFYYDV